MRLSKNFYLREFNCNCGCKMPTDVLENIKEVVVSLQILRDWIGEPIRINSAYRCEDYNRSIGGVSNSQHILGKAVDISVDTFTPDEVYKIVKNLNENPISSLSTKFNGIGRYNTFTHLDIRENPAEWDNRK